MMVLKVGSCVTCPLYRYSEEAGAWCCGHVSAHGELGSGDGPAPRFWRHPGCPLRSLPVLIEAADEVEQDRYWRTDLMDPDVALALACQLGEVDIRAEMHLVESGRRIYLTVRGDPPGEEFRAVRSCPMCGDEAVQGCLTCLGTGEVPGW